MDSFPLNISTLKIKTETTRSSWGCVSDKLLKNCQLVCFFVWFCAIFFSFFVSGFIWCETTSSLCARANYFSFLLFFYFSIFLLSIGIVYRKESQLFIIGLFFFVLFVFLFLCYFSSLLYLSFDWLDKDDWSFKLFYLLSTIYWSALIC